MGIVVKEKQDPQQLTFKAFDLAASVASLLHLKEQKKDFNEEINGRIKVVEKSIIKLSKEIEDERAQGS